MSDDEYDNIPDPFAGIDDVDWDALLSAPSATEYMRPQQPESSAIQVPRTPAQDYFDDEALDASFLAELDAVEQQATLGLQATTSQMSDHVSGIFL